MSRADYAHWNEEADIMWWQEEGRHVEEAPSEFDGPYDMDDSFADDDDDEIEDAHVKTHPGAIRDWALD